METLALAAITQIPSIQESIELFYSTFNKVITHHHAGFIKHELQKIDVMSTINIIEVFISKNNGFSDNDILFLCTERIKESINKIHELIDNIRAKLDSLQKSWLVWLWGINVSYELDELKMQKVILEQRIDTLIKMYMVMNK